MREVFDYVEDESPEWIRELVYDYQLSYESAYVFGEMGIEPVDSWGSVRIDAYAADDWEITIDYDDGSSETIYFGDDWGGAWALWDMAHGRDDVEAERGEIEY